MSLGPLHDQIADLAAGRTTSVALTDAALDAIKRTQPTLNCFRHVRDEAARADAEAADAERAADPTAAQAKPLLGVPIAIKDDVDIIGLPTHFGCGGDVEPATSDSESVRRLKAAGAIIVGKTNTPELGQWPFTDGPAFGHTRNPWNRELTPGGSSGGSAAAVAAGIVAAAVGSDGAGSVRIPASWTNLVGIKPQRGRISTAPWPELFNGITVIGPLAKTVADAALLLSVLSGSTDVDLHRPAPIDPVAAAARTPGKLRIGVAMNLPFSGFPHKIDPAVAAATEQMVQTLRDLGHEVTPVKIPYRFYIGLQFLPRSLAGLGEWPDKRPDIEPRDARTKGNIATGRKLQRLLGRARRTEQSTAARIGKLYNDFDVLLSPTTATPAASVHGIDTAGGVATDQIITKHCPMCWPWNVLGWPSVNIPAGFADDQAPMGVQLMGNEGSEELLISLAAQVESVRNWQEQTATPWW